ncbi:hypothetical protein J2X76_006283 [Neorhizobium sp. 2083]|uniref:DUF6894 family protein n=1 Tax=Neorhizobium sp. 2083 TaxID=2817762 RepID=UPI00285EA289|nr:hypothetical protein [Neorhizobium sp. 2083]MDR6821083.1 hypothetical protein [Neorhizobium sp. 2083]
MTQEKGLRMPLYYFHIRENGLLREDPEGAEFATLDQATEEAMRSAREILAEKVSQGRVVDGQVFEITDEEGTVRATIPFKSVLRLE